MHVMIRWVVLLSCLIVMAGCSTIQNLKSRAMALYLGIDQPRYSVLIDRDVIIPMSDGVKLHADLYRPESFVLDTGTPLAPRNSLQLVMYISSISGSAPPATSSGRATAYVCMLRVQIFPSLPATRTPEILWHVRRYGNGRTTGPA
jgi:hypothetical protein